jgi:hypothetical protein
MCRRLQMQRHWQGYVWRRTRHGQLPMPRELQMQKLKDAIARGRKSRTTSDEIVSMIVADWPGDVPDLRAQVTSRLKARMKKKYGSALAMFLFYMVAQWVVSAVIKWWLENRWNREAMEEWHRAESAKAV